MSEIEVKTSAKRGTVERLKDFAALVPLVVVVISAYRWSANSHIVWWQLCTLAFAVLTIILLIISIRRGFGRRQVKTRLQRYLRAHLNKLGDEMPVGSTPGSPIRVSALLDDSPQTLHISLIYRSAGEAVQGQSLIEHIVNLLDTQESVVVLGEPGQGKSVTLLKVYQILAKRFIRDPNDTVFPILIRMHALPLRVDRNTSATSASRLVAESIYSSLDSQQLIELDDISYLLARRHVVLILDGADEIRPTGSPSLNFDDLDPCLQRLFEYPSVLSCRTGFFDSFVGPARVAQVFTEKISLQDVPFDTGGTRFVRALCSKVASPDADRVIDTIKASDALLELARRPLTLLMVTDLLANGDGGSNTGDWSLTDLYENYSRRWLEIESRKGGRIPLDRKTMCIEQIAWHVFATSRKEGRLLGRYQLHDLLINESTLNSVATRVEDLMVAEGETRLHRSAFLLELKNRTFLIRSDIPSYYRFVHKSFFEFFTARFIWSQLAQPDKEVGELHAMMGIVISDEISGFLRAMLRQGTRVETIRALQEDSLLSVLTLKGKDSDARLMARQQAASLVPILVSSSGLARLRDLMKQEVSPLVRRGYAVRMAVERIDSEPINEFVREMRDPSSLSWSVHLGYNRVYYGDQKIMMPGWQDDGTPECEGIFRASILQLKRPAYSGIWPMSLLTVRMLMTDASRDVIRYLQEQDNYETLREAVTVSRPELGETFEEERVSLCLVMSDFGLL